MDLNQYLTRIHYKGTVDTKPETLTEICKCHSRMIPFDIFDMFGGIPKVLSMEKLYNDMIVKKRGGFCYEQNGLLCWALREIGFKVDMLQSQLYIEAINGFSPKFDHMCLMVTSSDGQKWLTDVGFGTSSFMLPLKFVEMEEQLHVNGAYRIRRNSETTFLVEKVKKVVIGGKKKHSEEAKQRLWIISYQFETTPYSLKDFEGMCKYQQENEKSFLKFNMISSMLIENGAILTWGLDMCIKKYIDPYTEEVEQVIKAKNQAEFKNLVKEKLGIEISFHLTPQERDFTGFT